MRSSYRTVLLWLLLIGFLLSFFAYFSGGLQAIGSVARWLVTVLAVFLCLGFFVFNRRFNGWFERGRKAAWLEATGRLDEAASQWEQLAKQTFHLPDYWAGFLQRQAWLCLRRGQEEEALMLLEAVPQRKEVPDREREHARCLLALGEALRGNLERAESLVEECQDAGSVWGVTGGLALQVTLIRRGEFEHALAVAVPPWDIAGEDGRIHRHTWALLRAFALLQLPPTPQRERDAQRTAELLRSLRPGELDYLTPRWPELRAFLDQRLGVARAMPAGSPTPAAPSETAPYVLSSAWFGIGLPERFEPWIRRVEWWTRGFVFAWLATLAYLLHADSPWVWNKLALLAAMVLANGLFLWGRRHERRRALHRNQEAVQALHAMRLDEAARGMDALLEGVLGRESAQDRQILLLNRAAISFKAGDRSLARRIFHALAHQDPRYLDPRLRAMAWEFLADCESFGGNIERAHEVMAISEQLWNGPRPGPERWVMTPLLRAIHQADSERVTQEAEKLHGLPGLPEHDQRRVVLLHAFALEQWEDLTSEEQAQRARFQTHLREEVVPGEFDYLAAEWPELGAFIGSLGKARVASPAQVAEGAR